MPFALSLLFPLTKETLEVYDADYRLRLKSQPAKNALRADTCTRRLNGSTELRTNVGGVAGQVTIIHHPTAISPSIHLPHSGGGRAANRFVVQNAMKERKHLRGNGRLVSILACIGFVVMMALDVGFAS
ncbi:hypothetical protein TcWFU_001061 [Taenia crassiceps]|uniref:Uncharacterized protein n=1 Tax=Taenia crassiceps TaxID=6207 RepID=A0ABR4QCL0_9CEST